jgi:hypothetical protein
VAPVVRVGSWPLNACRQRESAQPFDKRTSAAGFTVDGLWSVAGEGTFIPEWGRAHRAGIVDSGTSTASRSRRQLPPVQRLQKARLGRRAGLTLALPDASPVAEPGLLQEVSP